MRQFSVEPILYFGGLFIVSIAFGFLTQSIPTAALTFGIGTMIASILP